MASTPLIHDLQERLAAWEPSRAEKTVGTVEKVADGVVLISGLPDTQAGELLHIETPDGPLQTLAINLEERQIGGVLLGNTARVEAGMRVLGTGTVGSIAVGKALLGRVVNALGEPMDGKGPVKKEALRPIEKLAPGVLARKSVHEPLQTGIMAIDAMIPIGRGQRELIIGDRGTGKTAMALDAIINQRDTGVICIYVAIGQKEAKVSRIRAELEAAGAMKHTIIVCASAADPAAMQYLAPYAGCAIGEHFMESGSHALIIYDDLSKHAVAYRELSLLLRRPAGREAYPGDVFYLHSRLLERAAKLNDDLGGGSLTALPIIETQAGDVAAYIPTNVISITDGQIYLESDLFYQGVRPAVNVGISVSRVGGAAQVKVMKKVAGRLRLDLAQYRELAAFAQFSSDLDEGTQQQVERGKRLTELLKQPQLSPIPVGEQIALVVGGTTGLFDAVAVTDISTVALAVRADLQNDHAKLLQKLQTADALDDKLAAELEKALKEAIARASSKKGK
jgi:F-type H+-transporting ATPase subunit alpha